MVNTYEHGDDNTYKIAEELRLIRCVLERILAQYDSSAFVDYQMEKFGKDFKQNR